ncbi:GTP-dependent dephospho-CoA kinase family protein [Methanobrevibacter sp. DSM 116169]|uniref:GTP-dependent dephospho-CoA kinase family protein n=1 Tax=Methanobrevibacter sp. DSM 116169 TaxID=3242727 RepID=UPI0038FC464F
MGKLYPSFEDAIPEIKKSEFFISVGDATLNNLIQNNIYPNLSIIDNLIQRKNHDYKIIKSELLYNAKNPSGFITENLWETIDTAINSAINNDNHHLIVVDGEEDLAVLPCILIAPDETTIAYGQPNEGLVLLKVSDVKNKAENILNNFTKL